MLDEIHSDLPKPPDDDNVYTLGVVNKHKVAIACLPKGTYGNNAAARVATATVRTFPSIKFGLMVDIGAGNPVDDVGLGDVVVSTPTGEYPGVIQWDFGKVEEGGGFKRIGSLNNPPLLYEQHWENSKVLMRCMELKFRNIWIIWQKGGRGWFPNTPNPIPM
ncbi:hypothetical protein EYR41_010021 [Orbilia oligospora]|uniref:Nucleoside phosphorylase domain-containing protein n=1 Tax=Orbilia oligospora TaxID=2813651 RepID=A0A8H2DNM3_ORBOL|nr:hypothetical protein EYR41_010021 [Orbilia oligospora]